jgi:hypothetical protein
LLIGGLTLSEERHHQIDELKRLWGAKVIYARQNYQASVGECCSQRICGIREILVADGNDDRVGNVTELGRGERLLSRPSKHRRKRSRVIACFVSNFSKHSRSDVTWFTATFKTIQDSFGSDGIMWLKYSIANSC